MAERRPRGYGSVKTRKSDGLVFCRWRVQGRDVARAVESEGDGDYILRRVHELRSRGGMTLPQAIAEVFGDEQETAPRKSLTFAAALELYLDHCDLVGEMKPRTRLSNRQRGGILRAAPWSRCPFDSLGRKEVRGWATRRQVDGRSGKTVLNDLVLASQVWKWADDEQLLDPDLENPFLRARPRRPFQKTRRALDEDELRALGSAIASETPAMYPMFLAECFSGWRAGELGSLREADLHLDDERGPCMTIEKHREKTKTDKCAFLGEPLVSILRAERDNVKRLPTAYVFTDEKGHAWTSKTRNNRLRTALEAVSEDQIPTWKREADEHHVALDWHTLRHTVRSLLSSRGHRSAVVGELLGQKNIATARRYDHGYTSEAVAIAGDVSAMLREPAPEAEARRGGTGGP